MDLCPARSDAWRGWKASGGDIKRRQARGQPPRSTDHAYRAATRNRRERGRVCWSGWSTWWSERMPCSSAAPWGPLDALGRGPQSTENRPLCQGCESKVRGRRQPQNSRELAPMGWWTRPYAQTPVVWAFFACSTAPEHLGHYCERLEKTAVSTRSKRLRKWKGRLPKRNFRISLCALPTTQMIASW